MKKNCILFALLFILSGNLKSNIPDVFSSEKKLNVNTTDELFFKDFYIEYLNDLNISYNNSHAFYRNEKNTLKKNINCASEVNFTLVFGEKSCGKTIFIEQAINDLSNDNKNIIPIKITKTLFTLFSEIMSFLETKKNKKVKVFNTNTKTTYKFSIKDFTNHFFDFIKKNKKDKIFIFYIPLKDIFPKDNDTGLNLLETLQRTLVKYNLKIKESILEIPVNEIFFILNKSLNYFKIKKIKNLIENLKNFFKLINIIEEKNNLNIKTVIESDSIYECELINNLLESNTKNNLKEIIHLKIVAKKDLFNYFKKVLVMQDIKISDFNIRKIISQIENLSLIDSIKYINSIISKINKIENKVVTESFVKNLLISIKNSKNFEEFIKKSIMNDFFDFNNEMNNSEEKNFITKNFEKQESIDISLEDVAGNESAKEALNDFINYLKNPDKYSNFGIEIDKGILLHGPPGCGKTLLAKALAAETGASFFYVSGSDFNKIYVGTGSENIKNLFKCARAEAPSIIFIDEIDSIAGNRFNPNNHNGSTLNQLLIELDGFKKDNLPILVIGATNTDINNLDPAILRPGRLGKLIECRNPIFNERIQLAKIATKNKFISEELAYEYIAKKTSDFSGAEMVDLINSAALLSLNKNKDKIDISDFNEAFERMILGFTNPNVKISEKMYFETAYHELGHAFCQLFNKDYAYKFDSVSILPRNFTLGVTHSTTNSDEDFAGSNNKEELLANIVCSLGGMEAEQIFMNTTTTGVSSDLRKAYKTALAMVTTFGMGGLNLIGKDEKDSKVQEAIKNILESCKQQAFEIINSKKELIQLIAEKLVKEKVLYARDIEIFCKERGYLLL